MRWVIINFEWSGEQGNTIKMLRMGFVSNHWRLEIMDVCVPFGDYDFQVWRLLFDLLAIRAHGLASDIDFISFSSQFSGKFIIPFSYLVSCATMIFVGHGVDGTVFFHPFSIIIDLDDIFRHAYFQIDIMRSWHYGDGDSLGWPSQYLHMWLVFCYYPS